MRGQHSSENLRVKKDLLHRLRLMPPNAWANAWKGKEVHRKPTFQSSNKPPRPEGSGSSRGGLKSVAQSEPEVIVIIDSEDEAQVVPKPIVIDDSEADTVVQHKVEPKVANEYICISSDSEEDNHSPIEQPEHLPSAPPPVARANDDGMKASPDAIQPILSSDSTMDIEQQPNEQHQEQPSGGSPTLENIVPQLGDLALVTTPDESRALKLASPSPATPSSVPKSPASTTSTKNTRPHAPALYDGENGFFKSAYKSRQIPHAPPAIDKPSTAGATSSSSSTFVVAQVSCILEPNSKNNEDPPQAGMIGVANLLSLNLKRHHQ
ncbi:hypothetical protein BXZ70DRAFT_642487 [Cristinia sonorae]|uniref:Uncharacterized protein n=1 Tax=Cristinia sonorae TaxID=1940300 RepID=A0A8K0XKT2_9AGAR|nr:hypothetical protein BXZ70DRAFT_642487 [Cristinia sonorae]